MALSTDRLHFEILDLRQQGKSSLKRDITHRSAGWSAICTLHSFELPKNILCLATNLVISV
jgi:hypothetical protein